MQKIITICLTLMFAAPGLWAGETLTAFDILEKIDKNMVFQSAYSETDMNITIKGRTITKSMIAYSQGNTKSIIRFLSPARDKGTKILKIDDIVKVYYPSAERVMRLSGHMLRRSMMGSDFSYEDMTERSKKLQEDYEGKILTIEELTGIPCYVLELTSKLPKQTYFIRKIWVDKDKYLGLKEELYAKSGKLLKILFVADIESMSGRYYPTRLVMEDKLRKDSRTEMVIKKIQFDIPIPEETFSERNLLKK